MGLTFRLSKKGHAVSNRIIVYEVLARYHNNFVDQYAKTGVSVPQRFTDHNGNIRTTFQNGSVVIPKLQLADEEAVKVRVILTDAKTRLREIEDIVQVSMNELKMNGKLPEKGWLQGVIDGNKPSIDDTEIDFGNKTLLDVFSHYIKSDPMQNMSRQCLNHYKVMWCILARYEVMKRVKLDLDTLSVEQLRSIDKYAREEHKLFDDEVKRNKPLQQKAMEASGNGRYPLPRGDNGMVVLFKKFRAFIRWANGLDKDYLIEPLTHNNPFDRYPIKAERYGTPFYLTKEERSRLMNAELPPRLARQRDIFIFQSFVGCRVSDLWARTKSDIVEGALEYIPRKTKDGRPVTVRVPLTATAKEILDRYKDCPGDKLLPFVAQQQYNEDIKEMLKLAKIDRMVTVLNPLTGEEEKKPIYEVASSHMARRTFVGNLYKKVKDPNAIGKLSGHAENSHAFARYRDIDEEMAKELVSMLE